jgi:hypothetical protein
LPGRARNGFGFDHSLLDHPIHANFRDWGDHAVHLRLTQTDPINRIKQQAEQGGDGDAEEAV